MKKGRRMDWEGRRIVEKQESETKKAESQRAIEKEEITSTEFPEGGNTIYTKRTPPASQRGVFEEEEKEF